MAAYNGVNGAPMTENDLLAEPLKGEWGFDGVVVSDWARRATTASPRPGPRSTWPCPARTRSGASRWSRRCATAGSPRRRSTPRSAGSCGSPPASAPWTASSRPPTTAPGAGSTDAAPLAREAAVGRPRCCCATTASCRCGADDAAPGRRGRPRRRGRPAARRRVGQRPPAVRGHAGRRPAGGARRPRRGRHRRRAPRCRTRCAPPGPTSWPAPTGRPPVVLRWLDAHGDDRRRADRRTATIIRLLGDAPDGRRRAGDRAPASPPTRTATGGSASSASARCTLRRSTARRSLRGRGPRAGLFDVHEVFAAPPQHATAVAARRGSAGRRARSRYRWPADGFIFRVGLVVGPAAAAGRRGARARRRAGARQRRRGRRRRHQRGRRERGLRPHVAGAARPAGRAGPRGRRGQPAHRRRRQRRRAGRAAVARRGLRRPGVLVPGHGVRQRAGRRPARRRRARRPAAHDLAGRPGRRAGAVEVTPTDGRLEYTEGLDIGHRAYLARRHRAGVLVRPRPRLHDVGVRVDRAPAGAGDGRDGRRSGCATPATARGKQVVQVYAVAAGLRGRAAGPLAGRLRRRHRRARRDGRGAGRACTPAPCGTGTSAARLGRRARRPRSCRSAAAPATSAPRPRSRCELSRRTPACGSSTSTSRSASGRRRRGCPGGCRTARGSSTPTGSPPTTAGTPAGSTATRACWCRTRVRRWRRRSGSSGGSQVETDLGREPAVGAGLVRDRPAVGRGLAGVLGRARARCPAGRAGRAAGARCCASSSTSTGRWSSARLHATAQGVYEAFLNGERVGRRRADPGLHPVRRAARRCRPTTSPAPSREGRNALGVDAGRRLVPRADGITRAGRPVGEPARAAGAAAPRRTTTARVTVVGTGPGWRSTPGTSSRPT